MDYFGFIILFILAACNNVKMVIVEVNEGLLDGVYQSVSLETHKILRKLGLSYTDHPMHYYSFKGIPYAEPPINKLRFKDPQPHEPWTGVREAKEHCSVCKQFNRLTKTYVISSEDCLCLNIYSRNLNPECLMPVIFYIHGGQFCFGSGNTDLFGPEILLNYDVVLVTINYRMDSLGFLNLGTKEVPGNAGMKDQRLALKWVYDNIETFGGDPDEITIMGESAGSASVIYHMMSPMSEGLFKRAIAMSGVPYCEWAFCSYPMERSFGLGEQLGNDTKDPNQMLDFLQSVPASSLINKFPIVIPEEKNWNFGFKMTAFLPCPEKEFGQIPFMVDSPTEILKRGNITPVDLLIGHTSMEGLILVPEMLTTDMVKNYNDMRELLIPREILLEGSGSKDTKSLSNRIYKKYFGNSSIDINTIGRLVQYISDEVFIYSINRFIKYLPCNFRKYLYKFSMVSSRNRFTAFGIPFGIKGVAHSDDLVYLFESTISNDFGLSISKNVSKLIDQTVTLFTNFVKYGDPTPDDSLGICWPEYDDECKSYMNINSTLSIGNDIDVDVNSFWTSIHEQGGVELP